MTQRLRQAFVLFAFLLPLGAQASVAGGTCEPQWLPTYGGRPGFQSTTGGIGFWAPGIALAAFDDGSGPALYAGGQFASAGGTAATNLARWDGTSWTPVGNAAAFSPLDRVQALASHDDGSGPALYVGGAFGSVDGQAAQNVARWDGASWSAVGAGLPLRPTDFVEFDDGTGTALYAATSMPGGESRLERWDGTSWTTAGTFGGGQATTLAVYDDGSGPALYAGGTFQTVNGLAATGMARWDGSAWSTLGGFSGTANDLLVFDLGAGNVLLCGGAFGVGGPAFWKLGAWDGTTWSDASGPFFTEPVVAIGVLAAGGVPELVVNTFSQDPVTGDPNSHVFRRDTAGTWSFPGTVLDGSVSAFASADLGSGPELFAVGCFAAGEYDPVILQGDEELAGAMKWGGTEWVPVGSGLNGEVHALVVHDDGSGESLFVGGDFTHAGALRVGNVARWSGTGWAALGTGVTDVIASSAVVNALAVYDDGAGPKLFAGGRFDTAGGAPAASIARWDGSAWAPLGAGTGGTVESLRAFDDGGGEKLFVGGFLLSTGPSARWDGTSWLPAPGFSPAANVRAYEVFDFGLVPVLYAGSQELRAWNGSSWTLVSGQLTGQGIRALAVFDDGGGDALYAGGSFQVTGLPAASDVARWDGTAWSALGEGIDVFGPEVDALAALPDPLSPNGEALFVGGPSGVVVGGNVVPVGGLAKWNAKGWSPVASQVPNAPRAMVAWDDGLGAGQALIFGGDFTTSPAGDRGLARSVLPCDPPLVYCAPSGDSAGCLAAISTSDPFAQPTSGSADYAVIATSLLGQTNGLLVAGFSGPGLVPVTGGMLCLQPPVKRVGLQNSGGPGTPCSGAFAWTVNDGQAPPAGVDPGPGASAWYQWWYRDAQSPLQAALSDAVQLDYQ